MEITLQDDVILDVDGDGNGLLRMGVAIRRRGTREMVAVEFDFPTLAEWDSYREECAALFSLLAQTVPDMWLPDDMETFARDVEGYRTWAAVTATVVRQKAVAERLIALACGYLDPMVPGEEDGAAWLKAHMTVGQVVHLLALVMCVDDLIEKKTRSALTMIFPTVTQRRSSSASVPTLAVVSTPSSHGPTPELRFS